MRVGRTADFLNLFLKLDTQLQVFPSVHGNVVSEKNKDITSMLNSQMHICHVRSIKAIFLLGSSLIKFTWLKLKTYSSFDEMTFC